MEMDNELLKCFNSDMKALGYSLFGKDIYDEALEPGISMSSSGIHGRHYAAIFKICVSWKKKIRAIQAALKGCPHCIWDEAEGVLIDHCQKCRLKITMTAYLELADVKL